jgi:hypothetical protein
VLVWLATGVLTLVVLVRRHLRLDDRGARIERRTPGAKALFRQKNREKTGKIGGIRPSGADSTRILPMFSIACGHFPCD